MTDDAPTPWDDTELLDVPISAIEHFSYCPRQCALIHVEQTFEENVYTVRGRLAHERVDGGDVESRPGIQVLRALPLWSERLGLRGKADVVELRPGKPPFPVEHKVGRRRPPHADLQLCAQALCLEEMLGTDIPEGAVYSHAERRRHLVQFTDELRQRTIILIGQIREQLRRQTLPPAVDDARCPPCSLVHACLPQVAAQPARVRGMQGALFRPSNHRLTTMRELLSTLYVTTQGAVLRLEHDTIRILVEGETLARLPLVRLQAIVVFGRVAVTTPLIHRCAEDGRALVWMSTHGRFRARLTGRTLGNVLLRRAQHQALSDRDRTLAIARQYVAGKVQNARTLMLRAARDTPGEEDEAALRIAADALGGLLGDIREAPDLDVLRGLEGFAARTYFAEFGLMVRGDRAAFTLHGRTRRPPRDRANALLSFCYALLRAECEAALEGVGLDPQVGYLHALRPGRPALALDLMEELRPAVADRLVLRMVNRRQVRAGHFDETPGGAVSLNEEGRRATLAAYEKRKADVVPHRLLQERIPVGLIPHVQARLLARHLRGDLRHYLPYLAR